MLRRASCIWVKAQHKCPYSLTLETGTILISIGGWRAKTCIYSKLYLLNHQLRPPISGVTGDGSGVVRKVQAFSIAQMSDGADDYFRSLIIIIPNAGIFYCARERRKEEDGVARTFVLMCIDWLRLKGMTLKPSRGGYVKRIMRVVRFQHDVMDSASELQGFQQIIKVGLGKPVQDASGPLLPLDLYQGQDVS
jgi:hypothetical protein